MKMRKIGPSEILRNFLANEYELELLACIGIFPIFNVIDLYPYIRDDTKTTNATQKQAKIWKQQLTTVRPLEIDKVLDRRVAKRTRNK